MSDPCSNKSTTGLAIGRKLKHGAKFNFDFCEVAARLSAAGMGERDLAYVLGVKPCTIHKWKQRYEEFGKSCGKGKELATKYLIANGLRSAMGYDYEEIEQEFVGEKVVKEKRKLKHQPPNTALLIFFLLNLSDEYHNVKQVEVNETRRNVTVNVTGELESEQIKKLAGAAIGVANRLEHDRKVVGSEIIDVKSE